MHKFKGTPGPWTQDAYGNVVHAVKDGSGRMEKVRVSGVTLPGRVTPEYDANTKLVSAAPDLLEALQWALSLATVAMEQHRMLRVKSGYTDITGTYKNGETWVGIYQIEVDHIERARSAIKKALGEE